MLKTLNGIRLVRFEPTLHAGLLYQWYYSGEYQEFFREYPFCPSLEELAASVNGKAFIIKKIPEDDIVGIVMFFNFSETSRRAEVGMLIDKAFQGKKYGLSALKIFAFYLLNNCNLYKLIMQSMCASKRASKFVEQFGCAKEGTLKKHVYLDGEFHDVNMWAITKPEFKKKHLSDTGELTGPIGLVASAVGE